MSRLLFAFMFGSIAVSFAACGGGGKAEPTATNVPEPTATATAGDLAHSVVQIVALDDTRTPVWSGSGTVVSGQGFILTNAHVIDDRSGEYDVLGVAITQEADQAPEPAYLARIAAVDYVLDLAVIEVTSDLDGNGATLDVPAVPIGDSDAVDIGDRIRILGFPGIGGETITFTEGAVSGFTPQREIADRAWIKTDAAIAGGNSGGLAMNEAGEIIGVPTIAGSSEDQSEPVDCRFVVDTNRDGTVDSQDSCVPIGGFINGLRPIALALPLIDAAESGQVYVSPYGEQEVATPEGGFDTANVHFTNLVFSPDVTDDDQPAEVVPVLPTGATDVCVFWDYEGMQDGVSWEALWFVDGELAEDGSITDDIWVGGETGNWWVCNFDDSGLADGLYEVAISVEGDFRASNAIFIGGDHPPVDFTLENGSDSAICFVLLSPSDAANWGQDELGEDESIDAGQSQVFTVPASTYDLRMLDCDADELGVEDDLDLTSNFTYTLQ
jgi:S1-C subfamily serine protease